MMKFVNCFFMLLLYPLLVQGASMESDRQVVYKPVDGIKFKLHVFEPEGLQAADKRPAIVFFFGGGWNTGIPKQFYQQT